MQTILLVFFDLLGLRKKLYFATKQNFPFGNWYMKYYIIAGEASGDLHGSNLIKQIKLLDASANIRCWGGDLMQAQNVALVKHYKDLAFMGFAEVVKNLPTILQNIKFCKQDILSFQPDVLVLIDYPGFNLRIAKWANKVRSTKNEIRNMKYEIRNTKYGIQNMKNEIKNQKNLQPATKIVYYIAPQVWAWKENRVNAMKKNIDKLICILPFEKNYFKTKWNWDVEYVGHPLVEEIDNFKKSQTTNSKPEQKIIALLPGSRKQEILKKLPVMLQATKYFPDYNFIVAKAPGQDDEFYKPFLLPYQNVQSVRNQTYHLLLKSTAALVTSGTATLETALFGVPEVVCYKGSNISYQIAKRLIKIKFISLVNLIMNKLVVTELIQHDMNTKNIVKELSELLNNSQRQQQLQKDYAGLKNILLANGNASVNAAKIVVDLKKF